ncbi:hypothetical protein [Sorangium sp. So ce1078]|uniref:hypothetical protein n=1 Tax=Sorangium sp. So ce1078 TaxID=3133329 RepID=UPI003F5EDE42
MSATRRDSFYPGTLEGPKSTAPAASDPPPREPPESEQRVTQRCVDCGTPAPKTETNYTLISSRYGWRLTRTVDANGQRMMEWRCPGCYSRYRSRKPL